MGGGSLKGVPHSSKETWIIVFCPEVPTHLSGLEGGLSGFVVGSEWVCRSLEGCVGQKFLAHGTVLKTVLATLFRWNFNDLYPNGPKLV